MSIVLFSLFVLSVFILVVMTYLSG